LFRSNLRLSLRLRLNPRRLLRTKAPDPAPGGAFSCIGRGAVRPSVSCCAFWPGPAATLAAGPALTKPAFLLQALPVRHAPAVGCGSFSNPQPITQMTRVRPFAGTRACLRDLPPKE